MTKEKTFLNEWVFFSFSNKLKFALKVSISLTLAYLIPMAMAWSQPSTAAITIMLIASAGGVGESVSKGFLRVLGTILGGVIGLTLISLFPQERLEYLIALSLVLSIFIYMYYAYQGDGSVFMLGGMTMMMMFLHGAEDAFLYGVDRTYMTVFGIVIYTVVSVFVFPIKLQKSEKSKENFINTKPSFIFGSELHLDCKMLYFVALTLH